MPSKPGVVSIVLAFILMAVIGFTIYSIVTSSGYLDVADLAEIDRACVVTVSGVIVNYESIAEEGVLYIYLASKKSENHVVKVEFNYNQFVTMHRQAPGPWMLGKEIIVKGVFDPEKELITVREIMIPCHEGYGSPPARS